MRTTNAQTLRHQTLRLLVAEQDLTWRPLLSPDADAGSWNTSDKLRTMIMNRCVASYVNGAHLGNSSATLVSLLRERGRHEVTYQMSY